MPLVKVCLKWGWFVVICISLRCIRSCLCTLHTSHHFQTTRQVYVKSCPIINMISPTITRSHMLCTTCRRSSADVPSRAPATCSSSTLWPSTFSSSGSSNWSKQCLVSYFQSFYTFNYHHPVFAHLFNFFNRWLYLFSPIGFTQETSFAQSMAL